MDKKCKQGQTNGNKVHLYCIFTAILLAIILLTIVFGGFKIEKASAEQTNNTYSLNGYTFTFETSMKDLKKKGLFNRDYKRQALYLIENGEGEVYLRSYYQASDNNENLFIFYNNNGESINYGVENITKPADQNYLEQEFNATTQNTLIFNNKKITINLLNWVTDIANNNLNGGILVQFAFVNQNFPDSVNTQEQFDATTYLNYYLSKASNYTFELPSTYFTNNYLRAIAVTFQDETINPYYSIYERRLVSFFDIGSSGMGINTYSTYENISTYENNDAFIARTEPIYSFENRGTDSVPLYKGYYTLAQNLIPIGTGVTLTQNLNEQIVFGYVEPGSESNQINYKFEQDFFSDGYTLINSSKTELLYNKGKWEKDYFMLNVPILTMFSKNAEPNYNYNFIVNNLSDKVTGLTYTYTEPQKELNLFEQFKQDLKNMGIIVIVGGVLGFIGGLFIGNPIGGMLFGMSVGGFIGGIPVISDILQAVTGINLGIGDWWREHITNPITGGFNDNENNGGIPVIWIIVGLAILFILFIFLR